MLRVALLVSVLALSSAQSDPNDPCRDCRIENGVGYKEHPSRCDLFYTCKPLEGRDVYNATLMRCPCGLFWSQSVLSCIHAGDFKCPNDPCANNVASYPDADNCRAYWECEGQRTSGEACCSSGQRYDGDTRSCVADPGNTCTKKCPCGEYTTQGPGDCEFSSVVGKPGSYLWTYGNGRSAEMLCAPGLNFNATSCRCDIRVDTPVVRKCLDFSLRYNTDPLVDAAKNSWIGNKGVVVDVAATTGTFQNQAYITVPRYSNVRWPDVLGLDVEFNGQNNLNTDGPLIDNCDCNEPSTISMRLTQFGGNDVVEVRIKPVNDTVRVLRARYTRNAWNRAQVAYDGTNIVLSVKSGGSVVDSDTAAATGNIDTCQCGLKIGYAWENRYFNGLMRKTDVYLNCLPDNFI